MKRLLLFVSALLCLLGCHSQKKPLDTIEHLIWEKPDSALILLQSYDTKQLQKGLRRDRARYALLLSMALDKNYIDIASDSIISEAVNYYSPRFGKERMYSYYYQGLVFRNMAYYPAAMVSLEKAETDALSQRDWFYLGLINKNKAGVFTTTGNCASAIECSRQAVRFFIQADKPLYKQYAQYGLAAEYVNDRQYSQAMTLVDSLLTEPLDISLRHRATMLKATVLWAEETDPDKAIELYRSVPESLYYSFDFAHLAKVHAQKGQLDSAYYWLQKGYRIASSRTDRIGLDNHRAQIDYLKGDYKPAYELVKSVLSYEDSLTRIWLKESATSAQRDYYKSEAALEKEKRHANSVLLFSWIAISILAFIILVLILFSNRQKYNARLRDNLATLHSQEQELAKMADDNVSLLGSILSEKILYLDKLSMEYAESDSETAKNKVFIKYKEAVQELQNNKQLFSDIEELLNKYNNNVVLKFREQFPQIRGEKLDMVIMFFTRMPHKSLQLLFKHHTADSLKQARARLRKEIETSGAEDTQLFLEMLEMKKGGRKPKQ